MNTLGALALTFAAFSWAIGSLYNRGARLPQSPLLSTGMEMLAGGLGLVLLGTITGEWSRLDVSAISARSLAGLVYLIVFGSWIGFVAYVWLLRVAPTSLVSTYAYVNPLLAVLLGCTLGREPFSKDLLVWGGLIVAGVVLIVSSGDRGENKN